MSVSDKAVSTEDLPLSTRNTCVEVAKLEGVLNTLLQSKVEAIKNDKTTSSSLHSSPKLFVNRLRIASTSTTSSKDKDSGKGGFHKDFKRRHRKRRNSDEIRLAKHRFKRNGRSRQRISSSSPESPNRYNLGKCDKTISQQNQPSDEESNFLFQGVSIESSCPSGHRHTCCCRHENNGDVQLHFDEDYISLKIEDFDEYDETLMTSEALRRARRKRRRRRKRRARRHMAAMAAVPIEPQHVKVLEADELPQRARWTIVATACLLLFMCLLLVGVTLRMAPIIDDMVRKENQELINSINREHSTSSTTSISSTNSSSAVSKD
ncbi:uncharacterized protein [Onthophagus taurus]|uniref:uncharacterized protein n=1 Tax=Onthophagus taurus TaxID=166361 RepID=UPI0039BE467B